MVALIGLSAEDTAAVIVTTMVDLITTGSIIGTEVLEGA
jgi:hypothetical protein